MAVDKVDKAVGQDVGMDTAMTLKFKLSALVMVSMHNHLSHVQCFQCHQFSHYASNCLVPYDETMQVQAAADTTEQSGGPDDASDHVQFGIVATTNLLIKSIVPKEWILLKNTSTVDIFSNHSLLRNIWLINHCFVLLLSRWDEKVGARM